MAASETPRDRRPRLLGALRSVLVAGERISSSDLLLRYRERLSYSHTEMCTKLHLGDLKKHCAAELLRAKIYTGTGSGRETYWMLLGAKGQGEQHLDQRMPRQVVTNDLVGGSTSRSGKRRLGAEASSPVSRPPSPSLLLSDVLFNVVRHAEKLVDKRRETRWRWVRRPSRARVFGRGEDVGHENASARLEYSFSFLSFLPPADIAHLSVASKHFYVPQEIISVWRLGGIRALLATAHTTLSLALCALRALPRGDLAVDGASGKDLQLDLQAMKKGVGTVTRELQRTLRMHEQHACLALGSTSRGGRERPACRCPEATGFGEAFEGDQYYDAVENMPGAEQTATVSVLATMQGESSTPMDVTPSAASAAAFRSPLPRTSSLPTTASSRPLRSISRATLEDELRRLRKSLREAEGKLRRVKTPVLHPSSLTPASSSFDVLMSRYMVMNKCMMVPIKMNVASEDRKNLISRVMDVSTRVLQTVGSNRRHTKLRNSESLPVFSVRYLQKRFKSVNIKVGEINMMPIILLFVQIALDLAEGRVFMPPSSKVVYAIRGAARERVLAKLHDGLAAFVRQDAVLTIELKDVIAEWERGGGGGGSATSGSTAGSSAASDYSTRRREAADTLCALGSSSSSPPPQPPSPMDMLAAAARSPSSLAVSLPASAAAVELCALGQ